MKNILCYGDSNTHGANPASDVRLARDVRWTGVLQTLLGDGYYVIEEGLNGRTTVWEDPIEEYRNGKTYLLPCLMTHAPLDLVILMLGTNDMKTRFNKTAFDIAKGAEKLVQMIQASQCRRDNGAPPILLVSPAPVSDFAPQFAPMFAGAIEKQPQLAGYYQQVAEEHGCVFLNPDFMVPYPGEGLHFGPEEHKKLAKRLSVEVQGLLA
ncbi:MAG: SGNH/GDSL hydrolase family protein [Chloroflexota bacterium]